MTTVANDLYVQPTWFIDSDAPEIAALAAEVVGRTTDEIE